MPRQAALPASQRRSHGPAPRTRTRTASADIRVERLDRLRTTLRDRERDAALITNPNDIRYLTAFSGEDSFLLVHDAGAVVISDFRFEEDLAAAADVVDIHLRSGPIAKAAAGLINDAHLNSLALQAEHVTLAQRAAFAKHLGARKLHPETALLAQQRLIKSDAEVKLIRKAVRIQQQALDAFLEQIEPGLTELEACAILEYELKTRGSSAPPFPPIVAAKANGSKPHARPGKTKLTQNKPLLVDWGATVDGYCSDMTRTLTFAVWPKQIREVYPIVEEAFHAGVAACRPGVTGRDADAAARDVIERAGFGARFGHSLGHGIGLNVHEGPRLSKLSDDLLKPGMVVTVEPGIYLPGVGGVRIENDILVTERGPKDLCSLPTDMEWATR